MKDSYVILGYGSLIWDLADLAPHVELPWHMQQGPDLPMEFSRVSPKRKMGLVVVLDPDHGAPCPTHAIRSRRARIEHVAEDLRIRERAPHIDFIGAVCVESGFERTVHADIGARVRDWCERSGVRGAVWTDLPRNFEAHTGAVFSHAAAHSYLRSLQGESLAEAVRYIDNAPRATDTPLRRMLAQDAWWRGLARSEHR